MTKIHPYEEVVREMINRESDLFDRRSTALYSIQSILLTAVAFAWDKHDALIFLLIICLVGGGLGIALFSTIIAAHKAVRRLEDWWRTHQPTEYDGPGVIGLPSLDWAGGGSIVPLRTMQYFLVAAWLFVAVFACFTNLSPRANHSQVVATIEFTPS